LALGTFLVDVVVVHGVVVVVVHGVVVLPVV
jgi:hypothetical protein